MSYVIVPVNFFEEHLGTPVHYDFAPPPLAVVATHLSPTLFFSVFVVEILVDPSMSSSHSHCVAEPFVSC